MKAPFKPSSRGYRINKRELKKKPPEQTSMQRQYDEQLLHNPSFQQLFQGYYFSMDEEIARERAIKEAEFQRNK